MTDPNLKAVALRYPEWADAPYISAKAKGHMAQKVLDIAAENDIPLVEDAALVNLLSIQNVGSFIPEESYSAIATIFAFVVKIEDRRKDE